MRDALSDRLFMELKMVSEREESDTIHNLLARGDYLLECTYRFDSDQSDGIHPIPFGFIYRNGAYKTRLEVAKARGSTRRDMGLSRSEVAVDLARIGSSLADIYFKGFFKGTSTVLLKFMKSTFRWVSDGGGVHYQSRLGVLTIKCKQSELLTIYHRMSGSGELSEDLNQALIDPSLLLSNISGLTRLVEQPWLRTLTPDARASIEMGTQILDALYVEGVRELLPDYGALLFPFAKAVEIEIAKHFRLYSGALINSSLLLVGHLPHGPHDERLMKRQKNSDRYALFHVAESVLTKMEGFRPNMHSLYHFLSYYGLRRNLDFVIGFDSYLPDSKVRVLRGWGDDFRWILDLHYRRNKWAYGGVVEGSFEFELWYEDLCRLLRLLSELNAEEEPA